jgi:nitrate/nitrite transporter NarK
VLKQFLESALEHVSNKSAYLCGMMKTYRQNKKQGSTATVAKGPDEAKLKVKLDIDLMSNKLSWFTCMVYIIIFGNFISVILETCFSFFVLTN